MVIPMAFGRNLPDSMLRLDLEVSWSTGPMSSANNPYRMPNVCDLNQGEENNKGGSQPFRVIPFLRTSPS